MLTVFLNLAFTSCTPQSLTDEVSTPQSCCGEDGDIIPPPPPPPSGGN